MNAVNYQSLNEQENCYVCYEDIYDGNGKEANGPVKIPSCGHPIHETCYQGILNAKNLEKQCGICRRNFSAHPVVQQTANPPAQAARVADAAAAHLHVRPISLMTRLNKSLDIIIPLILLLFLPIVMPLLVYCGIIIAGPVALALLAIGIIGMLIRKKFPLNN